MPPDKYRLIVLGLAVHALLVLAVFDVYFSSPLEPGLRPVRTTSRPLAKRVVLFVADGLRAEAVFDEAGAPRRDRLPYLTGLIEAGRASWGVSSTRVPTESRPGHVAILAGIYEDPSAILKGWKANVVEFDSLIKRSSRAFCWGSPDIVGLFGRPDRENLEAHMYDAAMEDFASGDTTELDLWVFERVSEFLERVEGLNSSSSSDDSGDFFFLHLLGTDTAGHGHKPRSREYLDNVRFVDEHVRRTVAQFERAFGDDSTAFVFTSDHGMTEWGSHGAGTAHETETPLVAWGAGVRGERAPQPVEQIDVAPLIASLLGVAIPTDSLGVVPLGYLDCDEGRLEEIGRANVEQLKAIYTAKRRRIEESSLLHFEYVGVDEASARLPDVARAVVAGIRYYHDYYKYPVLLSVGSGFLLWIAHLVSMLVPASRRTERSGARYLVFVVVVALCYRSGFSWRYYLYFLFPFAMYYYLELEWRKVLGLVKSHLVECCAYLLGVELLVYGFFDRRAYSAVLLPICWWYGRRLASVRERAMWVALCATLAVFPALPAMRTGFDTPVYLLGYAGWVVASTALVYYSRRSAVRTAFGVQSVCLHCASAYVMAMTWGAVGASWVAYVIAAVPVACVAFAPTFVAGRLAATFLGLAPFYLLVSTGHEVIFSVAYCCFLSAWVLLETRTVRDRHKLVMYYEFGDRRRGTSTGTPAGTFPKAFAFVATLLLGFFGTGNLASLNAFDPMWARAFVTVFSPFRMAALVVLKQVVPFVCASCALRAVDSVSGGDVPATFRAVLVTSDAMVLNFLFLVRNEGSWLEIGTSLSHFMIMEAFVVVMLALYACARFVTTVSVGAGTMKPMTRVA